MQKPEEIPNGLRSRYQRTLELSFIITLLILCSLFFAFQKHQSTFELPDIPLDDFIIEVIPPTIQPPTRPPQPPRPSVLVADEELTEMETDVPIDIFEIDPTLDAGPPPEEEIEHVFDTWELSKEPEIQYRAVPDYPEIAKKAGIDGMVVVEVIISERGDVIDARITKGIPLLNEAVLEAAKKCRFSPAKQRDKFVKVRMSIPYDFRLN